MIVQFLEKISLPHRSQMTSEIGKYPGFFLSKSGTFSTKGRNCPNCGHQRWGDINLEKWKRHISSNHFLPKKNYHRMFSAFFHVWKFGQCPKNSMISFLRVSQSLLSGFNLCELVDRQVVFSCAREGVKEKNVFKEIFLNEWFGGLDFLIFL